MTWNRHTAVSVSKLLTRILLVLVAVLAGAQLFVGGCKTTPTGTDGNMMPTTVPTPTLAPTASPGDGEPFSCENIAQEARVRFTAPGSVTDNVVVLFYSYVGVPSGNKILRIIWDDVREPGMVEEISLGQGEPQRSGNLFDLEGTVEHTYNVQREEEKQVRVTLVIEGSAGGCSRVRDVTVQPPGAGGGGGGGGPSPTIVPTIPGPMPTP